MTPAALAMMVRGRFDAYAGPAEVQEAIDRYAAAYGASSPYVKALRGEAARAGILKPERESTSMPTTKKAIRSMTLQEAAATADDKDEPKERRDEAKKRVNALLGDEEEGDEPEEPKRDAKPEKEAPPPSKEEQARSYDEAARQHEARALASLSFEQVAALKAMGAGLDRDPGGIVLGSGDREAAAKHLAAGGAR